MKLTITLAVLTLSTTALADTSGYWLSSTGQVVRNSGGNCWHDSTWTPANAIPGCDGVPLTGPVTLPVAAVVPADADQDGVSDDLDKCPSTPGGAVVDAAGCPKALEHEMVMYLDVKFAFGKAEIESNGGNDVQKISVFMRKYPSVKVVVEGYTDDTGPADFNHSLSKQRADAVIAVLTASGVSASRLTAAPYGETHPMATNETAEGRRENRRVMAYAKADVVTLQMKTAPQN